MVEFLIEMNATGSVPERLLLVPAGQFKGRDGRVFYNDSPEGILSAFRADRRHIPIDVDHELELHGGGSAKGWITELVEERGAIYGRLELNEMGSWLVENRSFRYISPVFYVDEKHNILKVESVALTNKPNLYFKALNKKEEESMEGIIVAKEVCTALGVPEDSSVINAVAKIAQLQQGARGNVPQPVVSKELCTALGVNEGASASDALAKIAQLQQGVRGVNTDVALVPKADYEVALNRAETAERFLKSNADIALKTESNSAIDAAVTDGKIAPASKGYYAEQCSTADGLVKFKEFVKTAPKVIPAGAGVDGTVTEPNTASLNADEKAICVQMGVSEEAFALGKQGKQ